MRNVAHSNRHRLGLDTSGRKCFRIDEPGCTGGHIIDHGAEEDYLDKSVQTGFAMRLHVVTGGDLLVERPSVLRHLAESQLPVSPRALASVHLHRGLHRDGALRVFRRAGREAAAVAGAQVLAQGRL